MSKVETRTVYGIFNKHNGVLFAYESDKAAINNYNKKHFLVKELVLKPGDYFFGDYYTGKIYSDTEKPLIREDELEDNFYQEILKEYSIVKQLGIIAGILEINDNLIKTDAFKEFTKFLKIKKAKYEQSLKVIKEDKESFNFFSLEDLEKLAAKRLEGITD